MQGTRDDERGISQGVRFLGESPPRAAEGGVFQYPAGGTPGAEILLLVLFDASHYPLTEHCRYARHAGDGHAYTFPNFTFDEQPPGLRVGPWPAWRGIPPMPRARLITGRGEVELQFQFWGDELERHVVRAIGRTNATAGEELRVVVADNRLRPLKAEFYATSIRRPVPRKLAIPPPISSSHPRLLLSEQELRVLKKRHSPARSEILGRLRDCVTRWNIPLRVTEESKIPPPPEGLAPEDRLLIGAYLALLEGNPADLGRGVDALLAYVRLTRKPDFEPLTIDTQAGEVLFLLCVGYDWLYGTLSEDHRAFVRKRLWEVADICWNHLGYEREDYAQAHYLGCALGLVAFSLLFWDEHPRAREWGSHLAGVLDLVLTLLSPDGFYPHGINLWVYEFGFLFRWLELFRTAADLDLWPKGTVLRNAAAFRMAATSPDGLYGVTFGDPQYRVGGDSWCHYLIALRTGSGEARKLADTLRELPTEGVDFRSAPARRRVYEHMWYPDDVEPGGEQASVRNFPDGTQLFVRTPRSLFTIRSGPPMGAHRYASGLHGGFGHSDPCNGSFLYYAGGMVVTGPGPVYRRDTALHNIITVNGQGQIGDSAVWAPDFIPPSQLAPRAEVCENERSVGITLDCAACYLPHLGVRVMQRSVLVEPGRRVLGADLVELLTEASIEWNLHSWGEILPMDARTLLAFRVGGPRGEQLLVSPAEGTTWESGLSAFVPAYPNDGTRDRFLRLKRRGKGARFIWCIVSDEEAQPEILADDAGISWVFGDGTRMTYDGVWTRRRTPA